MQAGDILVAIDGKPVPGTVARFRIFLDELKSPDMERAFDVLVYRNRNKETLEDVRLPSAKKKQSRGFVAPSRSSGA